MHIQNEIVSSSLNRRAESAQICRGASGREHQRPRKMRIVPDEIGVFLFDQEVNTALREPGTQRANKR